MFYAFFLLFFFNKLIGFCGSLKNKEKENALLFHSNGYKYSKFIEKINVTKNHESGVYVDESLTIRSTRYANGKCPVYNKIMILPSDNYLTKYGVKTKQETLIDCAEVIRKSKFKENNVLLPYTGIYNMRDKQCYIIAGSHQFANDSSTCSLDVNQTNAPKCIYPTKTINDYVFLTHNIRHDYENKCPEKCNDNTEFGKLENGQCLQLNSTKSTISMSATNCAIFLFDNSPHEGVKNADQSVQKLTNGVGYNWANYYNETQKCVLYNEAPSCIKLKKNVKAFVSTAKVNGDDCEPFPETTIDKCVVKDSARCGEGIQNIYNCDKGLCHKTVNKCALLCSMSEDDTATGFNIWYVIGPLLSVLVLAMLAMGIYCFTTRKKKKKKKHIDKQAIPPPKEKTNLNLADDCLEATDYLFWQELHKETNSIIDKDY